MSAQASPVRRAARGASSLVGWPTSAPPGLSGPGTVVLVLRTNRSPRIQLSAYRLPSIKARRNRNSRITSDARSASRTPGFSLRSCAFKMPVKNWPFLPHARIGRPQATLSPSRSARHSGAWGSGRQSTRSYKDGSLNPGRTRAHLLRLGAPRAGSQEEVMVADRGRNLARDPIQTGTRLSGTSGESTGI
jgi:hypothetical protein